MSAETGADRTDDLTRISGIGPKIAHRLNEVGIWTYGDLASRSAADIGKLIPDISGMSAGRVDGWRQQAEELAATLRASDVVPAVADAARDAGPVSVGQHYESFLVRVLLNDDLSIRSTGVQHIRTGAAVRWPGWQPDALTSLIAAAATERGPERVEHRERREAGAVASTVGGAEAEPGVRWKPGGRRRRPAAARLTAPRNMLAVGEPFLHMPQAVLVSQSMPLSRSHCRSVPGTSRAGVSATSPTWTPPFPPTWMALTSPYSITSRS